MDRAAGVVTATINRPNVRNPLDAASFEALRVLFVEVAARDEDRVVVLAGAGGTFSSGGDLRPAHPTGGSAETHRMGLVNRVVPAADVAGEARNWAERLATLSPLALRTIERSLRRATTTTLADALEREAPDQGASVASPEVQAAFGRGSR